MRLLPGYIKTTDANNLELLSFLEQKNYHVNKRQNKIWESETGFTSRCQRYGPFAVLGIILAMMLFSFYLQLVIARSKDNLQLLLLLGYSPGWLGKRYPEMDTRLYDHHTQCLVDCITDSGVSSIFP